MIFPPILMVFPEKMVKDTLCFYFSLQLEPSFLTQLLRHLFIHLFLLIQKLVEFRHFFWLVSNFSKNIYYFFQPIMRSHAQNFLSESCGQIECRATEAVSSEEKQVHNVERNTRFRGKTESYVLSICCPPSFFSSQPSSTVLGSVTSMVTCLKWCSTFLLLFYYFAWFWQVLFIYLCGCKCGDIRLTD